MFEYDVAISFANEQRTEAEAIAQCLTDANIKVFYDRYEEGVLWGKDLYTHLAEIYQKKARYCLMLVSAAYAQRVWTNHERRNAQARALSENYEYILPVRFDETDLPGLPTTVGYLSFKDHGTRGVCKHLLDKIRSAVPDPRQHVATGPPVIAEPEEYRLQRRQLPDTPLVKKILSESRWNIRICPAVFKQARFRDVTQCRDFMLSSYVRVHGWHPYPSFSTDALETEDEYVRGEFELDQPGSLRRKECWALFRSGQFVQHKSFDYVPQLGDRLHVLEVLDVATAVFELAARMASCRALSAQTVMTINMLYVDGLELTWPQHALDRNGTISNCWCQDKNVSVQRLIDAADLDSRKRELALDVAIEIYSRFGWASPPAERLATEQGHRFGET